MNTLLPERKKLPHGTPFWVPDDAVFFVTVNCRERGINSLCHAPVAAMIRASVEFRMVRGDWWVHLFLLMPDHLHMLVSFPRDRSMRTVVHKWKEFVAKQGDIRWQRDFFDHRLRLDESRAEKAAYIRANPARAGLIKEGEIWPYQWFWHPDWAGRAGPPDPPKENGAPSGRALPQIPKPGARTLPAEPT